MDVMKSHLEAPRVVEKDLLRIQYDLALALGATSDLKEAMDRLLDAAFRIEGIDCGGVYLVDVDSGGVDLITHKGFSDPFVEKVSHFGAETPQARLVTAGKPVYWRYPSEIHAADYYSGEGLRGVVAIPVRYKGQVVATLNLASHTHDEIPVAAREALEAIAAQIGGIVARVKAETALRESERRFACLFEEAPVGYQALDADGRLTDVNRAWLGMLGYSKEKVRGRWFGDFLVPEDRDKFAERFARLKAAGEIHGAEYEIVRKDGTRITVSIDGTIGRNERGRLAQTRCVIRDVTDRRRAEKALEESHDELERRVEERTAELLEANRQLSQEIVERKQIEQDLRRSEERFRLAFEEGPLGMGLVDINGKYLQVNRALCRMLGSTREQLRGESVVGLAHARVRRLEMVQLRRVISGEIPSYTWEDRYIRQDGRIIWTRITATAVHDQQGKPICGLGMVENITERKQAEEALRESEERFRLAFEEGPLGMGLVDLEGKFLQANRAFCKMMGYSEEELWGRSVLEITHAEDRATQTTHLKWLTSGEIPSYTSEKRYVRKDGQTVWARLTATSVRDRHGTITYSLGMFENITERKHAEEALFRAERLASVGTLAAGIAHEINNPLGAIALSVDAALLTREQPDGEEILEASLKNIQAGAIRCGRIVKSVLQFARNEESQKWLSNLNDVARRARDMTRKRAAESGVSVALELDGELGALAINPTEMEQVFVNLIYNAVEASRPEDCVNVRIEHTSESARILVEDQGCGMTETQLKRVFDPFYTTRKATGGTGLGLSITHGIIQGHGGEINVKSRPGGGTTVAIILPLDFRESKGANHVEDSRR
jgi:PAS domain S-box-containing protein